MLKFLKLAVAAAVAATLFGGTADAQNWNLNPAFGTLNLRAGFLPDPRTRRIQAGGDSHFNGGGGCPGGGWFANAPDYRVNYSAGNFPLTFYVSAPGDTMLLVNDPAGQWFCNDDYNGLDPLIRFDRPRSGQYDVWLGTYNRSRVRNSTLYISEY